MPPRPPMPPMGYQPGPGGPRMHPPQPEPPADEEPPSKRMRTEDSLMPEMEFLHRNKVITALNQASIFYMAMGTPPPFPGNYSHQR